jgi:peroxiredoxin (alkyl hydroperoxide reductase subunit C)
MLTIGSALPSFDLQAVVSREPGKEFARVTNASYPRRWLVLFAWPMDFTFVCPTEIAEFGARSVEFAGLNAQLLGLSTDTHYVHLAWRQSHPALRDLPFPMLADTRRELSQALGILHPTEGVDLRATFVVDPQGVIRFASAHDLKVGRNVDEVLRTLAALQTDRLTPCNWKRGDKPLEAA